MVDLEKRFTYWDWECERHEVTAKKLCEDITKELAWSNDMFVYLPVMEVARMVERPDFPYYYAEQIKIAVLKWFSHYAGMKLHIGRAERRAINRCYNSLSGSNPVALESKVAYLENMIKEATRNLFWEAGRGHCGPEYSAMYRKWVNEQVEEWIQKDEINFAQMQIQLRELFKEFLAKAEKDGVFSKDEAEYQKFWEE